MPDTRTHTHRHGGRAREAARVWRRPGQGNGNVSESVTFNLALSLLPTAAARHSNFETRARTPAGTAESRAQGIYTRTHRSGGEERRKAHTLKTNPATPGVGTLSTPRSLHSPGVLTRGAPENIK